ncbi:hypothetical protein GOP47_0002611 [Adiantum capillus-veneris]|uniref:Uncharacterized protein n=1 Tax=Adiantum capillus-veneris TaxID=13818 RepID=A0A9D4ZPA0_ADICA|nr:hypothetical protein GOP47_0002611 [Adiantum capillus-veneris]
MPPTVSEVRVWSLKCKNVVIVWRRGLHKCHYHNLAAIHIRALCACKEERDYGKARGVTGADPSIGPG